MKTKRYRTMDKSDWGPGAWQKEPDKLQWQDKATGLPCLIVRNRMGALCGYVGVAKGHPDYRKDYHSIRVNVHREGLSFSGFCQSSPDESRGVCHVPDPGEPDHVWWLGFDCGLRHDLAPALTAYFKRTAPELVGNPLSNGGTYRNLAYARKEVRSLAAQLKARAR